MKCLALLLVATTALAEPPNPSQHARVGLLAEIAFGEGSTRLPDAAGSELNQVAAWAEDNFDGLIVLDGHADHRGAAAHNIRLSLRRARLVRDHLIALGVDPDQIIISAFDSEARPRARVAIWGTRDTLESVVANRRRAHALIDVHARPRPPMRRR